jgi:hypothetical protein
MKKFLVLSCICVAVVISCGKKIVPESDANKTTVPVNDKRTSSASKSGSENATTNTATTPSFNNMKQTVPPDGQSGPRSVSIEKGKSVYLSKCGTCHALKNIHNYTDDRWEDILKVEIPRAKLGNDEAEEVTAFILEKAKK